MGCGPWGTSSGARGSGRRAALTQVNEPALAPKDAGAVAREILRGRGGGLGLRDARETNSYVARPGDQQKRSSLFRGEPTFEVGREAGQARTLSVQRERAARS